MILPYVRFPRVRSSVQPHPPPNKGHKVPRESVPSGMGPSTDLVLPSHSSFERSVCATLVFRPALVIRNTLRSLVVCRLTEKCHHDLPLNKRHKVRCSPIPSWSNYGSKRTCIGICRSRRTFWSTERVAWLDGQYCSSAPFFCPPYITQ